MKRIVTIAAVMALAISATAFADSDYYVVASVNNSNMSIPTVSTDSTIGAGFAIGRDINKWAAVEIAYDYLGKGDATVGNNSNSIFSTSVGINAVFDPSIGNVHGMNVKAIGRIGYACTQANIDFGNTYTSFNDSGLTYGAGLALTVSKTTEVVVDYRHREISDMNVEIDSVNFGLVRRF